jgi:hypothetical protein
MKDRDIDYSDTPPLDKSFFTKPAHMATSGRAKKQNRLLFREGSFVRGTQRSPDASPKRNITHYRLFYKARVGRKMLGKL